MSEGFSLAEALQLAKTCCIPPLGGDWVDSPAYWRRVFTLHFGCEPIGDKDEKWDELFRQGYPAYRRLEEKERQQEVETASA